MDTGRGRETGGAPLEITRIKGFHRTKHLTHWKNVDPPTGKFGFPWNKQLLDLPVKKSNLLSVELRLTPRGRFLTRP